MKTSDLRKMMAGKRPSSYARRELGSVRLRLAKQNGLRQSGKVTGILKEAQKSIENLFMLAAKEWLSCWLSKCQISFYSSDWTLRIMKGIRWATIKPLQMREWMSRVMTTHRSL